MITGDQTTVTNGEYGITHYVNSVVNSFVKRVKFGIFWCLLEMNQVYWWKVMTV